ncbi:MAG: AraC family transcriptional regulator [Candidatus Dactylopiibacterium carminicum]|nr:MAG: AraC family transcriptional regulator [Candidatus Dactylopiibacterium carminicum]
MASENWIHHARDAETGLESLRAHFKGHAYDPHRHDSYLVGVTEQGVQQFNCRRARFHSQPGHVFTLNPGEIHDGDAPHPEGFTYSCFYLDPAWLRRELCVLSDDARTGEPLFAETLTQDLALGRAFVEAFGAWSGQELRIVRQAMLDQLLARMAPHLHWAARPDPDPRLPRVARLGRDFLHANLTRDVGLDDLAAACGVDRFRLTRAFKAAFGLAPHAYLVQLRLARARHLLAQGQTPAMVASTLGFADQSHLGRWFRRAFGLTPAQYARRSPGMPQR